MVVTLTEPIKYTYFSAEGSYPKEGYKGEHAFRTYSQWRQRIWTARDSSQKGILSKLTLAGGEFRDGWIPFDVMLSYANEFINVNGDETDFREAYRNWTCKWENGYVQYQIEYTRANKAEFNRKNAKGQYIYRNKDGSGKLIQRKKTLTRIVEQYHDSQGNPPPNWDEDKGW